MSGNYRRGSLFATPSHKKSEELQMEKPTEKTTLLDPLKSRERKRSHVYGAAERAKSFGFENKAFDFDKQFKEIVKDSEPKPQAKEWDADDQFDHVLPLHQIINRYHSDTIKGLSDDQVEINRSKYGANILSPPQKKSQLSKFIQALVGGLNALLLASAGLSFAIYGIQFATSEGGQNDDLYLGIALVIVVFVSGMFTFYQELKSDRIMESFKKMVPRVAVVYRNGARQDIDAGELVVGDIIEVKLGDLIPADIRIVDCQNFKVDNSSLTGESEAQKRSKDCTSSDPMETTNLAFFSTNAIEGHATGLVVRVGEKTLMGRLATLSSTVDAGRSPIGVEMDRFILIMTIRSFVIGVVFLFIAIMMGYHWLDAIFFIIGIMVANIPEGLSVTFTMILSLTAKRMASKNCLVKHLQAVEALGSTSVICSDKTGTLTQNKMTVSHMWFNDKIHQSETSERRIGASFDNDDPGFSALGNVAALCSRAIFKPGQEDVPLHERIVEGDASEAGILKCMEDQYGDIMAYRALYPKVCEIPFNSTNKFQVSIHDMQNPADQRYLLVMKGAPERIISLCTTILIQDKEYPLNDDWKDKFEKVYTTLGSFGERVLGFCDYRLPIEKYPPGQPVFDSEQPDEFLNEGFRFVGLISMVDPPKSSVPNAVEKCRSAGIKVVMVTGDHPITAAAIAKTVGIISHGNFTRDEIALQRGVPVRQVDPTESEVAVLTGSDLKQLSSEELKDVLKNHEEIVFARTSPEQKYIIVSAFQELGNIVAATGDVKFY
ncbi:unnamed protein product [Orchesella dallaii]|uniref:Na(+)/K(+)-exchanging ATPase n=1 Tax=Orchesella dallaii TaxID=48710 RepID=A0ABP1S2L1_9HEXA